ncbi:MAG: glycosyltransferase family 2 protein [Candidatus Pacebacteria bacterium]|nr:glycosyltransferase family 2 protein [Candidatus Paceibacterota bacterium]
MARISCVICAYNEADRIQPILDVVVGHPDIAEVIVVNDGSTDATEALLRSHHGITLISYPQNKGKTFALSEGIAAAQNELVMLLDADLSGITASDIRELAHPVLQGTADASISLRRNSLWIYRLIGLDFVSGERVLPRALLEEAVQTMQTLPRWGGEVFMNEQLVKDKRRIAVVRWPNVNNVRKYTKVGLLHGVAEELRMINDACSVISLQGVFMQNIRLLRLKVSATPRVTYSSESDSPTLRSM